jgi:hypothetical protein
MESSMYLDFACLAGDTPSTSRSNTTWDWAIEGTEFLLRHGKSGTRKDNTFTNL